MWKAAPFVLGWLFVQKSGNIVNYFLGLNPSDGMLFNGIRIVPTLITWGILHSFFKKLNLKKEQVGEEAMANELVEKLFNYLEIPDEVEESKRELVIMEYVKQNGHITLNKACGLLWCGKAESEKTLKKLVEEGTLKKEKKFLMERYL